MGDATSLPGLEHARSDAVLAGNPLWRGLALRVVTQLAYRPALPCIDSCKYLPGTGGYDPVGYNFLLKPLLWAGELAVVAGFQHLLGLTMALALYATLTGATPPAGPPPRHRPPPPGRLSAPDGTNHHARRHLRSPHHR